MPPPLQVATWTAVIAFSINITGCALAQHCYNGDVSFLWENGNFDPVKSKPVNRLTHNLSGLIMYTRWTFVPNLVKSVHGGLLGKGVKYNVFVWLFYFFSRTNVQKIPRNGFWCAMVQKTRNRARMCLFGVIRWKIEIWPLFTPNEIWPLFTPKP